MAAAQFFLNIYLGTTNRNPLWHSKDEFGRLVVFMHLMRAPRSVWTMYNVLSDFWARFADLPSDSQGCRSLTSTPLALHIQIFSHHDLQMHQLSVWSMQPQDDPSWPLRLVEQPKEKAQGMVLRLVQARLYHGFDSDLDAARGLLPTYSMMYMSVYTWYILSLYNLYTYAHTAHVFSKSIHYTCRHPSIPSIPFIYLNLTGHLPWEWCIK